ncbi:MAG: hypothetical protein AB7I30_07355 [Isosphaeraceae bacterium]
MPRFPRRQHRPRLDRLESRALLAGNVTVAFSGGDLVITGDGSSNAIEITQVFLDYYRVVGKSAGGSATKINNVSNGSFDFILNSNNYYDDLRITMKGGNDSVTIRGDSGLFGANDIDAPDDLDINMGGGDDRVDLQYVEAQRGDVLIELGTGKDTVFATNVVAGDDFVITSDNSTSARVTAHLNRVTVADELKVALGGSADVVNVSNSRVKDVVVKLRGGDDKLSIRRTTVTRKSLLDGGTGSDKLNRYQNNTSFDHEDFNSFSSNDANF